MKVLIFFFPDKFKDFVINKMIREFTDLLDKKNYDTFRQLYIENPNLQKHLNIKSDKIQIDDIFYSK